jgi:hypothetical protein
MIKQLLIKSSKVTIILEKELRKNLQSLKACLMKNCIKLGKFKKSIRTKENLIGKKFKKNSSFDIHLKII